MKPTKYFSIFFCIILFFSFTMNNSLAISIPQEKEIAKEFMEMIKKKQMILNDPIGYHILCFFCHFLIYLSILSKVL